MTMGPEGAKCDAPGLNLRTVPIGVDQTAMMPNLPFGKGEFLHHAGRIEPVQKPVRTNVMQGWAIAQKIPVQVIRNLSETMLTLPCNSVWGRPDNPEARVSRSEQP